MSVKVLTHKDVCPYYEENCIDVGCVCPKFLAYEKVNDAKAVAAKIQELGVDPNGNPLQVMLGLQKLFAERFHKIENLTKDEVDYWTIKYDSCVTDEITEVHEHLEVFPDMEPKDNLVELQKEFIDIWHFLMDEFLVASLDANTLVQTYDAEYGGGVLFSQNPLEAIFINERNYLNTKLNGEIEDLTKEQRDLQILIYSNLVLAGQRRVRQQISWKHWKKPSAEINFAKLHSAYVYTFRALVQCFILSGMTSGELLNAYIKKNLENVFRQEFGY